MQDDLEFLFTNIYLDKQVSFYFKLNPFPCTDDMVKVIFQSLFVIFSIGIYWTKGVLALVLI